MGMQEDLSLMLEWLKWRRPKEFETVLKLDVWGETVHERYPRRQPPKTKYVIGFPTKWVNDGDYHVVYDDSGHNAACRRKYDKRGLVSGDSKEDAVQNLRLSFCEGKANEILMLELAVDGKEWNPPAYVLPFKKKVAMIQAWYAANWREIVREEDRSRSCKILGFEFVQKPSMKRKFAERKADDVPRFRWQMCYVFSEDIEECFLDGYENKKNWICLSDGNSHRECVDNCLKKLEAERGITFSKMKASDEEQAA